MQIVHDPLWSCIAIAWTAPVLRAPVLRVIIPLGGERRLVCLHHWRFSHGSRCFKQRVGVCSYAGGRLWMNEWIFYNSLRPHARSLISPPSLLQTRDITFNCACALTKHKPGTMDNVWGCWCSRFETVTDIYFSSPTAHEKICNSETKSSCLKMLQYLWTSK